MFDAVDNVPVAIRDAMQIPEVERTLAFSKLRCLSFHTLAKRLLGLWDEPEMDGILCHFSRIELTERQKKVLARICGDLLDRSDETDARSRSYIERVVRRLVPLLTSLDASSVASKAMLGMTKSRRQIAYRIYRKFGLDAAACSGLLGLYRSCRDPELLILVARNPCSICIDDFPFVLRELKDEYWRARMFQWLIEHDLTSAKRLAAVYPESFVWAAGRSRKRAALQTMRSLLEQNRLNIRFLSLYIWAAGHLQKSSELAAAEALFELLKRRLEKKLRLWEKRRRADADRVGDAIAVWEAHQVSSLRKTGPGSNSEL